jgi:hypothetical protein
LIWHEKLFYQCFSKNCRRRREEALTFLCLILVTPAATKF